MCEKCGSMRPTYPGSGPDAPAKPREPGPVQPAGPIPYCSECEVPLQAASDGYRCQSCRNPPWYQRMFIAWHCPKCRTRLNKSERGRDCPKCGYIYRVP